MKKDAKKRKQKRQYDDDDGRSFTDMNVEGMPYYDRLHRKKIVEDIEPFTKKERKRLIIEAYKAYLPMFIVCIIGFTMVYLFLRYVWLR